MLEKLNSIKKFKYSFIALFSLIAAITLNLVFIFNVSIIALLSIACILFIVFSFNFFENSKQNLTFSIFFLIGLLNSSIYNYNFRVFELDNKINNEKSWVQGKIAEIKIKNKYARIYVEKPIIYSDVFDNLENNYTPKMIISTHASRIVDAKIGDSITAKLLLKKPQSKLFQDDFDYQDYLLQNQINLTGQVWGSIYITPPEKSYSILEKIRNFRLSVADKIKNTYDDSRIAGISTALITGFRGQITNETKDEFKKSGLAHLMAISGMHMAFLAGIIFFIVRYLICLIPPIALNYNSKNIAGVITIGFAFFYLLIAGNSLPTTRAFLMILFFVLTMLIGRTKVAIHTLCVIAICILIVDPMAIFSASFQLSFSAVFAMLFYNQSKQTDLIIDYSKTARIFRNFLNTVNISIIAFIATMFIVAVHFGYISIFAIAANVVASLLMALAIMPSLFLFFIGYILLDIKFFASLNEVSLNLLANLAEYFANFNNSSIYISNEYSLVLLAVTAIVLSLIIFDISRKYLISICLFAIAFIIPVKYDLRPHIIEFGNNAIGLRQNNNLIILGSLEKRELKKVLDFYRLTLIDDNLEKSCDIAGCLYNFDNKKILLENEGFIASYEELKLVDFVIYKN